jgi:hypothetical protein
MYIKIYIFNSSPAVPTFYYCWQWYKVCELQAPLPPSTRFSLTHIHSNHDVKGRSIERMSMKGQSGMEIVHSEGPTHLLHGIILQMQLHTEGPTHMLHGIILQMQLHYKTERKKHIVVKHTMVTMIVSVWDWLQSPMKLEGYNRVQLIWVQ